MVQGNQATYKFGEATFTQLPLLAAQELEVVRILKKVFTDDVKGELVRSIKEQSPVNPGVMFEALLGGLSVALTGDALYHLIGAVIIRDGESRTDLADVTDFVHRGKLIMFSIPGEMAQEMVNDFFSLNHARLTAAMEALGVDVKRLTQLISQGQNVTSSGPSKRSRKGGGNTRR